MLRDIDEKGGMRELKDIDYRRQFDEKWDEFTPDEQRPGGRATSSTCGRANSSTLMP